ncbi:MAG: hypothetical protein WC107_07445 [Patescibacteria group bacterium]
MRKPIIENLESTAAEWNAEHPVGTPVTRYKLVDPLRMGNETKTRSEAWVMGGHSVMIMVEGVPGGVLLESVVSSKNNIDYSKPPNDCPVCGGGTEWYGTPQTAHCYFCGHTFKSTSAKQTPKETPNKELTT